MMKVTLSVFFFCFILGFNVSGQKGLEVGGMLGTTYYVGDLSKGLDLGHMGFAFSGLARYNFNERICGKVSLNYGHISGDDARSDNAFNQRRNLSFRSNIWDLAAQIEFNFLPYAHWSEEKWYTPYLFAGFSVFKYNPKADLNGETYFLRDYGTEGQQFGDEYLLIKPAFVYGGGMKWNIDHFWSINLELSFRGLFTDYLDDVSGTYPDKNDLRDQRGDIAVQLSDRSIPDHNDEQVGALGRQRGNGKSNDSFNFITIGVVYFLGQLDCPPMSRPDWN